MKQIFNNRRSLQIILINILESRCRPPSGFGFVVDCASPTRRVSDRSKFAAKPDQIPCLPTHVLSWCHTGSYSSNLADCFPKGQCIRTQRMRLLSHFDAIIMQPHERNGFCRPDRCEERRKKVRIYLKHNTTQHTSQVVFARQPPTLVLRERNEGPGFPTRASRRTMQRGNTMLAVDWKMQ